MRHFYLLTIPFPRVFIRPLPPSSSHCQLSLCKPDFIPFRTAFRNGTGRWVLNFGRELPINILLAEGCFGEECAVRGLGAVRVADGTKG